MRLARVLLIAGLSLLTAACAPGQAETVAAPLDANALIEALAAPGAEVEDGGAVEQAFFSVDGRIIHVDGEDVQVFEYPDTAARQAESELIQPDGSPNPTTMVSWIDQPNFWARGRLIVLYVGRQATTIERLSSALGQPLTEPWPGG
jgi:hypothetical protein